MTSIVFQDSCFEIDDCRYHGYILAFDSERFIHIVHKDHSSDCNPSSNDSIATGGIPFADTAFHLVQCLPVNWLQF